jgi:glycosyltransferase involved in cell wall biosynthesis
MTRHVLLVHPHLSLGGSEVVVAWIAQALVSAHSRVTIATVGKVALDSLDRLAGTKLESARDQIETLNLPARWGVLNRTAALRGATFARQIRAIAGEYDVAISGYEYLPFGVPGIHYVNGDACDFRAGFAENDQYGPRGLIYRPSVVRSAYLSLCSIVAGARTMRPSASDILVAVSSVTARNVYRLWQVPAVVIHPPVPVTDPGLAWQLRENTVVMLGRIDRSKRLHEGIKIVQALRERKHNLRLKIVGPTHDRSYLREILELGSRFSDWLEICGQLGAGEKRELLGRSRYLLHCKRAEPFGISIVEAAQSGCICIAPKGGGYEDFIDDDELLYVDATDAVDKFDALLGKGEFVLEQRQKRLRLNAMLVGRDFEKKIVSLVDQFTNNNIRHFAIVDQDA